MRRTLVTCALVAAATCATMVATAARAGAATTAEVRFAAFIAAERVERGLPPLRIDATLAAQAASHSARMAAARDLFHSDTAAQLRSWSSFGENVGRGSSASQVHALFMSSPDHRENILNAAFTNLGIGVVVRGGQLYVTEMFAAGSTDGSGPDGDGDPGSSRAGAGTGTGARATAGARAAMDAGAARASIDAPVLGAPRPRSNTVEILSRLFGGATPAVARGRGSGAGRSDGRPPRDALSSPAPGGRSRMSSFASGAARARGALEPSFIGSTIDDLWLQAGADRLLGLASTAGPRPASRTRGPPPDT